MIGHHVISTILRHDAKVTSYKMALLRAINDVVLSFPDLAQQEQDVAVPLRLLAEFWVAYYWPFVGGTPVYQGTRSQRGGVTANDIEIRPALTTLRQEWERGVGPSRPSDGFQLIHDMRLSRKRTTFPKPLVQAYQRALRSIAKAIQMPIQHAGPGQWSVFAQPAPFDPARSAVPVPGTIQGELCLRVGASLWATFVDMSLWVEALCIHEWCLFTERVEQDIGRLIDRGAVYVLLTDHPQNRRPLTWERHCIDLLLLEGALFTCPWTGKMIKAGVAYDLDHLIPVSIYPINELWNLVPADPYFNSHKKRDHLPSPAKMTGATPRLVSTYTNYTMSKELAGALSEDAVGRFTIFKQKPVTPSLLTEAVIKYMTAVTASRNVATF